MYSVYLITSPLGKSFIGKTKKDPNKRLSDYKKFIHNDELYKDIQEYGWNNFIKEIIYTSESEDDAVDFVVRYIKNNDLNNPDVGYNRSTGGKNPLAGLKHTPEWNKKIGDSQRGELNHAYGKHWKMSDEAKLHLSQARMGMKFTEEHRANISKSKRGSNHPNFGKKLSEETKQRIRENRGRKVCCVETGEIYDSAAEATRITGITNIARACASGCVKGGYHWKRI